MKNKKHINSYLAYFLFIGSLLFVTKMNAQKVDAVTLGFSDACVSASHNQFTVSFKWIPPLPNGSNQYIIELSDDKGDFSNPTTLATITGRNTTYDISTTVKLPETVSGDAYKIRVSSTNPATSAESNSFSAYYVAVTTPMKLNNGVSTLLLCPGHSQEISLNVTTAKKYKWYRNNTVIPNETGHSLKVSAAGTYHAVVDYGNFCSGSSNSRSNNVVVTVASNLGITITGSNADGYICRGSTFAMNASIQNPAYTYKWYKNDQVVDQGPGKSSYTATDEGKYFLGISVPGTTCEERTNVIEVKYKENFKVEASLSDANENLLLLPGSFKDFKVTTTAENPSYQWFLNGNVIAGATAATYRATQVGEYSVKVTQGGSCPGVAIESSKIKLESPSAFEVEIGYKSASYQDCLSDKATLVVKKITAIAPSTNEKIVLGTASYDAFTYQWLKGATEVSTQKELLLEGGTKNGEYALKISFPSYTIPESNKLSVKLLDTGLVRITNPDSFSFCEDSVTLNAQPISATANYIWYKDNVKIEEGVGKSSIEIRQTGAYHVEFSEPTSVNCPGVSNAVFGLKTEMIANWADATPNDAVQQVFISGKNYPPLQISLSPSIVSPTIKWFKNGAEIAGETGTELQINQPGAYYATLETTGANCPGKKFTLPLRSYVNFNGVKATIGFKTEGSQQNNCNGTATQTTLELQRLEGRVSADEVILISPDDYQYFSFGWTKDGNQLVGENDHSNLLITKDNSISSAYALRATYGTIIGVSNQLAVSFASVPDVKIQTENGENVARICEGGRVKLISTVSSSSFSYQWYKGNTKIEGAVDPTYETTELGAYFLEVSSGACTKKSADAVTVSLFDPSKVKISYVRNESLQVRNADRISVSKETELRAEGGNISAYMWETPSNSRIAQNITINESGIYTLTVTIGATCTPVVISFEASVTEVKEIPNVVTPNNDTKNDFWEIPSEYQKENVRIRIYSQEGKEVLNTTSYDGKWPNQSIYNELGQRALLFLYIIEVDGKVDKRGVITLMR